MRGKFSKIKSDFATTIFSILVLFSSACGQSSIEIERTQKNTVPSSPTAAKVSSNQTENVRLIEEIRKAITNKDYEKLAELLKSKPNLNVRSEGEDSLLADTMFEDTKAGEMLINAGADPTFKSNIVGCGETEHCLKTPLYIAFSDGNLPALEMLLKGGANPNTDSILGWAASRGNEEAVKILLSYKADVNHLDELGRTSLYLADNPKIAKILIENGADINITDNEGNTVLMFAVKDDNLPTVLFFIGKGLSPNAKNKNGETVLQLAKAQGNRKIINELKKSGAIE